jgi:hypothetical protein
MGKEIAASLKTLFSDQGWAVAAAR